MRDTLEIDLSEEDMAWFVSLQEALGHDEPEQTFHVMLHLLSGAVNLTSRDHPSVRLYTRDPGMVPMTQVSCPRCQAEVPIHFSQGDGFRECSVRLF